MRRKKKETETPKKRWSVSVPFTGYVTVEVEADDKEAAIDAAFDEDLDIKNAVEAEFHHHVVQGNVCSAVLWDADAEEIG